MWIMEYDMSDVKIRAMVEAGHSPREWRMWNRASELLAHLIECGSCKEPWPCDARRQLMSWHEAAAMLRGEPVKVDQTTFDNGEGP